MADDNQGVDVALGQKTQRYVVIGRPKLIAVAFFKGTDLQGVCDDVAVGDHDAFLYAESY